MLKVNANDHELIYGRRAWTDPILQAHYRQHRPMVERAIAWLVAHGNRRVRYRGIERNHQWLGTRAAALNLRRLVRLGLHDHGGGWAIAS